MESRKEKRSCLGWGLTVEGPLFVNSLIVSLNAVVIQNLYLQKFCSPDGPPGVNEVCHRPESLAEAADVNTLRTVLRECVTAVPVLLGGVWRDRTGRSLPLMVLSLAGEMLATAVVLSGYYWWSLSPWLVTAVEGSIVSLTGGKLLFSMAAYCYIAEHTPNHQKTNRLTMLMVALLAGASISMASSGYILSALNYPIFFIIVIVILILNIGLCFIFVKETPKKQQSENERLNFSSTKILFHSRPNNLTIWVMLTSAVLLTSTLSGEANVFMYYLEQGFDFSVTQAGLFTSFYTGVGVVGSLVFSPLATNVLKWNDLKIEIVCLSLSIFCLICTALAKTALELYLITLLQWPRAIFISVGKSIMSKLLKSEELGVFFSFITIGEAVIPLAFLPLYDYIFKATLKTLPGAFFFLSSSILFFIMAILWLLVIFEGNCTEPDTEKQDNESNTNKDLTLNKDCDIVKNIEITNSSQVESEIS